MDQVIDLKALLVEREDCDAGTIQRLREGLTQGGAQFKNLKDVNDQLKKRLESAPPALAKKLQLKLGVVNYFLGYMNQAIEHLKQVDMPLGFFYLGRALVNSRQYDEATKAFDKAEKAGYSVAQVQLQRAGIHRSRGEISQAKALLSKLEELSKYSAEFHFQVAGVADADGDRSKSILAYEKAIELDPGHTGSLFQLGYMNDLAGNDEEAISYYERCLKYPPVNKGVLNNLGILYEDNERFDKAADCYGRLLKADANDDRARLFLKDAQASVTQFYNPDEDQVSVANRQVMEVPVTDFELSVRSRNCLKKMGIRTLGDLTRINEISLLGSKNFGETSLDEIRNIMHAKGLRIGQSIEQGARYEPRYSPTVNLPPEQAAAVSRPVSELNLSVRARKCMNRLNITTIGELLSRTGDELMEAKNFGVTSLNEVREKLTIMGLKLRGD
ncbi:DNA-directed RNA polymerase subunit alpha C-terminal domain-containing protein [Zavarzinella formosa]|uniref:DNA-directed RNA polymerase subunit alpha C-terminal domain-containing protein n=1 Tax=Zavarzinella formosa TaxID=360055 RepID=UPI0002EDA015|nr:DNA-directed RNA polymerase subunit alpha C-terminal domain-containing protein [Zavarzinella formosa]